MVIIDEKPPGEGGASAVAAGLLHPFTPRGKLMWLGREGFESSLRLLKIAQQHAVTPLINTGSLPSASSVAGVGWGVEGAGPSGFENGGGGQGLMMLAKNEKQAEEFKTAARAYPDDLEV